MNTNGIVRLQCVFLFVDRLKIFAYLFAQITELDIRFALVSEIQAALFYDNKCSVQTHKPWHNYFSRLWSNVDWSAQRTTQNLISDGVDWSFYSNSISFRPFLQFSSSSLRDLSDFIFLIEIQFRYLIKLCKFVPVFFRTLRYDTVII